MEEPRCMRCGEPLVKVNDEDRITPPYDEDENFGCVAEYKCPHCLTYYTVTPVDPEEKENYPAFNEKLQENFCDSNHGYDGECPECGSHIVWQSDFMRSEVWGDTELLDENGEPILDEYGLDVDDSLVSYVACPYCGAYIEIVEAKPSELKARDNESQGTNTGTE